MNTMLNISVVAVAAALCGVLLKKTNIELSFIISVSGLAIIIISALGLFQQVIEWIEQTADISHLDEIINVLVKALGIAVIANITSQQCKDCGENGLAVSVELVAKAAILIIILPMIDNILQVIEEVMFI